MTVPVLSYAFLIVAVVAAMMLLLVLVYAKFLIFAALLVIGLLYLKYQREKRMEMTT